MCLGYEVSSTMPLPEGNRSLEPDLPPDEAALSPSRPVSSCAGDAQARFASVIVATRTGFDNEAFDYIVPEPMRSCIKPGALVVVPFGSTVVTGCVTRTMASSERATREISDVMDESFWPGEDVLRTVLWLSRRYLCPPGIALKAALMAGSSLRPEVRYASARQDARGGTGTLESALERNTPETLLAHKILGLLGTTPRSAQELTRDAGRGWRSEMSGLLTLGLVSKRVVYVPRTAPRAPAAHRDTAVALESGWGRSSPLSLMPAQRTALETVVGAEGRYLLFGVTGSGKTEVYMRIVEERIAGGGTAIVLIPEISLTPQTVARFRARFGDLVAVLHSGLTHTEKRDEWLRLRRGDARVAVGARSCIFAPVGRPSVVVVDEEHDQAYKQNEHPKYHARELALERSNTVILGSATPSLESYHRALAGEFTLLRMPERVLGQHLPQPSVVDMRVELERGNRSIFSRALQDGIRERLKSREQVILFLNRRGFSTFVLCRDCGYVVRCPWCDVSLTYHASEGRMRCHYCDYSQKAPDRCPKCSSHRIRYFGAGTERVVEEVRALLPDARVLRMDSDTTSKRGAHGRILRAFRDREADVLVGTQMISKGHDLPGVTLVGVVSADTSLHMPDFRAAERTFQMVTQVAGRSGRGDEPGDVIVQTYNPDHYAVVAGARLDYDAFYSTEIGFREELGYPPFGRLLAVSLRGRSAEECESLGGQVVSLVEKSCLKGSVEVLGPAPCSVSRVKRVTRWRILLKSPGAEHILEAGRLIGSRFPHASVSLDPEPEELA